MGAVSSSQLSVSITAGSALYTVHVHVQVEVMEKVCFINGTKKIIIVCDREVTLRRSQNYSNYYCNNQVHL